MIIEALAAGGGTFATFAGVAWLVHRPERRERRTCERMHRVAALEREVYGEVVSPDVAGHVKSCSGGQWNTTPFDTYVRADQSARAGEPLVVRQADVEHLRRVVAECEEIKRVIQELEDAHRHTPSRLILTGPDPREEAHRARVKELRDVLAAKYAEVRAVGDRIC